MSSPLAVTIGLISELTVDFWFVILLRRSSFLSKIMPSSLNLFIIVRTVDILRPKICADSLIVKQSSLTFLTIFRRVSYEIWQYFLLLYVLPILLLNIIFNSPNTDILNFFFLHCYMCSNCLTWVLKIE